MGPFEDFSPPPADPGGAPHANRDDYAVVVGIKTYPKITPLAGPENDAQNVASWLLRPDGGDVPPENIALILSSQLPPPPAARPTMSEIESAFDALRDWIKTNYIEQGRQARRLYIYLAGHGFCRDDLSAALLMANADYTSRLGFSIEGPLYAEWFHEAAYFKEIVVLMDCCRTLFQNAPRRGAPWLPESRPAAMARVKMFYGFATKGASESREAPIPAPDGPHQGLFTRAFLDALQHADPDPAGRVTGAAVEGYVYNCLGRLLPPGSPKQEPRIVVDRAPERDIVWAVRAPRVDNRVRIRVEGLPAGATVEILDPEARALGAFSADAPIDLEDLTAGMYGLRLPDGGVEGIEILASNEITVVRVDARRDKDRVSYERF